MSCTKKAGKVPKSPTEIGLSLIAFGAQNIGDDFFLIKGAQDGHTDARRKANNNPSVFFLLILIFSSHS